MRALVTLGTSWLLGACVSNTIVLESDDDVTGSDEIGSPTDGPQSTTAMPPLPPSTSTSTTTSTSGPTTEPPPIPDVPEPVLDVGSTDTDGLECDPPCPPGEVCVGGLCFESPDCGFELPWLPCLLPDGTPDDSMCPEPDQVCLSDGTPATVGICTVLGCQDECDCPLAPATVSPPTVQCEDLTGTGDLACYLDCSNGVACPEDMICAFDFICIYPAP